MPDNHNNSTKIIRICCFGIQVCKLNPVAFIKTSLSLRVQNNLFLGIDANEPNRTVIFGPGKFKIAVHSYSIKCDSNLHTVFMVKFAAPLSFREQNEAFGSSQGFVDCHSIDTRYSTYCRPF